jgi:rhamnosyltransferase
MKKIAVVVVLFNPDLDVLDKINTYINQVQKLFVIDNSDNINGSLVEKIQLLKKTVYVSNKSNIGIAASLNLAASMAIEDGFDLLLTMDQDSLISDNFISEMLEEFERDDKIGVLSPYIVHIKNPQKSIISGTENVTTAITSGSIIRLRAHKEIGSFLEKLFIDYVDHEYCLRMRSFGFKILRLNSVYIYHELGDVKTRKFFFIKVFPTNHPPQRWYYRTRNRFYVYKIFKNQFPDYIKIDKRAFFKELLKICLYEKNKIQKFKMIMYGYLDFKRNKFGKLIN